MFLHAANLAVLVLGRVFLGFGVGYGNQTVTLYNTEMAPARYRGAMNILFQVSLQAASQMAKKLFVFMFFLCTPLHPPPLFYDRMTD